MIGMGIATVAVWAGVIGIILVCGSFNILSGEGVGWLVFGGMCCTGMIWIDL